METSNNIVPIISALVAILSAVVTGYLAIQKSKEDAKNTRDISDREQNVDLVEDLQKSNKEMKDNFMGLYDKYNQLQATCADLKAEVASMRIQKEQWQKEREAWQKERELWQQERTNFDRERAIWKKMQKDWETERNEFLSRIQKLESKGNKNAQSGLESKHRET